MLGFGTGGAEVGDNFKTYAVVMGVLLVAFFLGTFLGYRDGLVAGERRERRQGALRALEEAAQKPLPAFGTVEACAKCGEPVPRDGKIEWSPCEMAIRRECVRCSHRWSEKPLDAEEVQ